MDYDARDCMPRPYPKSVATEQYGTTNLHDGKDEAEMEVSCGCGWHDDGATDDLNLGLTTRGYDFPKHPHPTATITKAR